MPLPLTVSCFSKIQIGFTFLVPTHPGSPGKRAIKRVCVYYYYYYYYFLNPGTQFPGNEKNYAMQYKKVQKSSWNELLLLLL